MTVSYLVSYLVLVEAGGHVGVMYLVSYMVEAGGQLMFSHDWELPGRAETRAAPARTRMVEHFMLMVGWVD